MVRVISCHDLGGGSWRTWFLHLTSEPWSLSASVGTSAWCVKAASTKYDWATFGIAPLDLRFWLWLLWLWWRCSLSFQPLCVKQQSRNPQKSWCALTRFGRNKCRRKNLRIFAMSWCHPVMSILWRHMLGVKVAFAGIILDHELKSQGTEMSETRTELYII